MSTKNVYFVDGVIARVHLVGIIAYLMELEQDEETEFTRFYMYNHETGAWTNLEFQHHIVSAVYVKSGSGVAWYLLSRRGVVIEISPSGSREMLIRDADTGKGKLGYLSQIKLIDGVLYCCGYSRQVYRYQANTWAHIDQGILAPSGSTGLGLLSIDGNRQNNIYAVGYQGEMYHYDGSSWRKIDLPTNVDLNRVKVVRDDLVLAAGNDGVLIMGSGTTWELISDPACTKDLWGVEHFNNKVYVSSLEGVFELDGVNLLKVDMRIDPAPKGFRLDSMGGLLWSFGQEDLAFFDGAQWKLVTCPDNATP